MTVTTVSQDPPVTATPAPQGPHVDVAALADPAHPNFHISLGQVVGLALVALSAYQQQDTGGGPKVFLNPVITSQYLAGILSIFPGSKTA